MFLQTCGILMSSKMFVLVRVLMLSARKMVIFEKFSCRFPPTTCGAPLELAAPLAFTAALPSPDPTSLATF
jgi:hypothetical protein